MMKKLMAALLCAALAVSVFVSPAAGMKSNAEGNPYIDISTDHISLSPQADKVKMNVAAKNLPEDTVLYAVVADKGIATVDWVDLKEHGYVQLELTRGEILGQTTMNVYVKDHPEICRQISVANADVAESFRYEGSGSQEFYGINMAPIPYSVHVVSDDEKGFFALHYTEGSGDSKVLVNKSGAYTGDVMLEKGCNATILRIQAKGHWTVTFTPVLGKTTKNFAGNGDKVSARFKGDDKNHDVYCANYAPKGHFAVWLVDIDDNNKKTLLCNGVGTVGKTKKSVYLNSYHSYYISVKSTSDWKVDFQTGEEVTTLQ